jgi:hypothetical protein
VIVDLSIPNRENEPDPQSVLVHSIAFMLQGRKQDVASPSSPGLSHLLKT